MCACTPEIRTPFCGKPGCGWPHKKLQEEKPQTIAPTPVAALPGWRCPNCGGGNSPMTSRCPCIPLPYNPKPHWEMI